MLKGGFGKGGKEKRADEAFKDFRGWAKKRDRAVRGAEIKGFTGFRDREDEGVFPEGGEVGMGDREVKEMGKVGNSFGT